MTMRIGVAIRFALGAVAIAGGGVLVGTSAGAAVVPETGEPGLLWLEADPYPAQSFTVARGQRVHWAVTANLDAPTSGGLALEVSGAEPLAMDPAGLRLVVAECGAAWEVPSDPSAAPLCPAADEVVVIAETPVAVVADGRRFAVGMLSPGIPRHFLATLSLPVSTPGALADAAATIGLGFIAADDTRPAALPETGSGLAGPLLLGIGVLLAGSAASAHRRPS